jgi:ribosomal protein S26
LPIVMMLMLTMTAHLNLLTMLIAQAGLHTPKDQNYVYADVPLPYLLPYLSHKMVHKIAMLHHITILDSRVSKSELIFSLQLELEGHSCVSCSLYCSVFSVVASKAARDRKRKHPTKAINIMTQTLENNFPDNLKSCEHSYDQRNVDCDLKHVSTQSQKIFGESHRERFLNSVDPSESAEFPPAPVDDKLCHKIIGDFCENLTPDALEEAGCAVCGQLVPVTKLIRLKAVRNLLHMLHASGVTRLEHSSSTQPIREIKGPVLDYTCN